jgi:hypothetical protein
MRKIKGSFETKIGTDTNKKNFALQILWSLFSGRLLPQRLERFHRNVYGSIHNPSIPAATTIQENWA